MVLYSKSPHCLSVPSIHLDEITNCLDKRFVQPIGCLLALQSYRIVLCRFTLTSDSSPWSHASTQLNMLSYFSDDSTISYQNVISGVTVWPKLPLRTVFKYLITERTRRKKSSASHQSKYCGIVHWMKQMRSDSLFLIVFSDNITKNGFRCCFAYGLASLVPLTKIIATERASICKDIMVIFFPLSD